MLGTLLDPIDTDTAAHHRIMKLSNGVDDKPEVRHPTAHEVKNAFHDASGTRCRGI